MEAILFIGVIIAIVVLVKKSNDEKNTNNVSEGKYDADISRLEYYYSILRQNASALGVNLIGISTYFFVLDGRVDSSSSFLAVSVRNVQNPSLAEELGMEVENLNGEIEHRFVLKGRYSQSTKRAILAEMQARISKNYPNDVVEYDTSIPALYCMIDMKDVMRMLNN